MNDKSNLSQIECLDKLNEKLVEFLLSLELASQAGHFLPCVNGTTAIGKQAGLGFSCFALKLYYTLGIWEELDPQKKFEWISFIKSFQANNYPGSKDQYLFIDPPVLDYIAGKQNWRQKLTGRFLQPKYLTNLQQVIIAETKQAIATLEQVHETVAHVYSGFPVTPTAVRNHLSGLDWHKPWGAGGQAAALVVFLKTQTHQVLDKQEAQALLDVCICFFESLADKKTGAYFKGDVSDHGQLINGTMKVLTALDWLGEAIHYPERLIDTCLSRLPSSEGCHLVDVVYVLYRCLKQNEYKRAAIQTYCFQILDMIKQHHNADGAFSYYIGKSQTIYYGVPITHGLAESDIHGTCLLAWAIAMILEILENDQVKWQVIKP